MLDGYKASRQGEQVRSVGLKAEKQAPSRLAIGRLTLPRGQIFALGLLLTIATLVLYYPVNGHPFADYDDGDYVTENLHVKSGLHWSTVKWAFTTYYAANWHPLTWISHAADVQFFHLDPGRHHDVNLLLHTLNVILLYWVLWRATGYVGRSAMVAALFALHPINVESVVWIAERKNLLSMTFFLLALGAYRWYVLRPQVSRYLVVALLYTLGLMCKPQVITLPCVLLLWDYWPLGRMFSTGQESSQTTIVPESISRLVLEKIPLFALSAASAVITIQAQGAGGATSWYPPSIRLGNAIISYASYLGKAFLPVRLSPMYPHPGSSLRTWHVAAAFLLLLGITGLVIAGRRHRYLMTGWLWLLGTLVPMIGLVQVGVQAMADRYAYEPFIGLFIMACWGLGEWREKQHLAVAWLAVPSIATLLVLMVVSHRQIDYWRDHVTLWTHALQVTSGNSRAENNLGMALLRRGQMEDAIPHFRAAVAIDPSDAVSNMNVGIYEHSHRNLLLAIEYYKKTLSLTRNAKLKGEAYNNLGYAYKDLGDYVDAQKNLQSAVSVYPEYVGAWISLGLVAQKSGDFDLAIQSYSRAMQLEPSGLGYVLLAQALEHGGQLAEAQAAIQRARDLSDDFSAAQREANRLLAQ
jgi:protein O-mannosyl-transferase